MSEKELKVRIQHKHDVEANWVKATNFIPKQAELIIYDPDSTYIYPRIKVGDGVKTVNDLPFVDEIKANKNEVSQAISTHNTATDAHADIREAINKVLPEVNEANNGEFLRVSNGMWTSCVVNNVEGVVF